MRTYSLFALFIVLFVATSATGLAACHAVGPSASGNGSGSDWNNRMNKLPATLVRGDTYYLIDGSYGSYSFTTSNSGTTRITIKKAQSYDYGRSSDGCSNDISAGWSVGSMGNSQAVFSRFNGPNATPGYITLDGNGRSTEVGCGTAATAGTSANDCGIKFANIPSSGPFDIGVNAGGANRANGWTIRYVEVQGPGDVVQDQNFIWCHGGCDALLIEHVWWYNSACNFLKIPWTASATIRNSYFKQNYSNSTNHGQFYLSEVNTSNVTFYDNVIQDIQGTGIWVVVTGGQASNYDIYNNVLVRTQGSNRPGTANGIFACINSGSKCTNWKFIGNSVVNYKADYSGALGILNENNNGGSYTWQNNLFYNSPGAGFTLNGASFTEDHNSWLNSGSPRNGSGDVTVTSGAPNPFVNWPGANFELVSQNPNWSAGATLPSPYNVDMDGSARPGGDGTWNRGAYEYGGTQAPAPPTGLTTTVR
jgi:hypothetical protein